MLTLKNDLMSFWNLHLAEYPTFLSIKSGSPAQGRFNSTHQNGQLNEQGVGWMLTQPVHKLHN